MAAVADAEFFVAVMVVDTCRMINVADLAAEGARIRAKRWGCKRRR